VLREALSRLLREEWEDASLIVQLVVEGIEPAVVVAERGVRRAVLVEQLRNAVDDLAMEYEDTANAHLVSLVAWAITLTRAGNSGQSRFSRASLCCTVLLSR
jgi:hypothetical protein